MRKLVLSLFTIAGIVLGWSGTASANATTGLGAKPAAASESAVEKVGWRRHGHHRFGGLFFGFGYPAYYGYGYGYPRYRYYDDDDYYYRPRYYYYGHRRHRHHRHHRW